MLNITLAGGLGRDAEYKTTQNGQELCSFPVGVTVGWGENKSTVWVDVTKWGKGAQGLSKILTKGTKVAVSGELSTREHNGKTYLQCRADVVTPQGGPNREPDGSRGAPLDTAKQHFPDAETLDDSIPFATNEGIY